MTYVFYHSQDFDGICSGEICKFFLQKEGCGEVKMIGWDYSDGPIKQKIEEDDVVYVVDLAIPELMNHPNLIWIDHHKTAIDKYDSAIQGYRIDGVAACRLCWQWFNNTKLPRRQEYPFVNEPLLVKLLGLYDVWDKTDERAEILQFGLRTVKNFQWQSWFENFKNGEEDSLEEILLYGSTVKEYVDDLYKNLMLSNTFDKELDGLRFKVFNGKVPIGSNGFKVFDNNPDIHGYMSYYFNGSKLCFSLYHHPLHTDLDLSEIAVARGGGGHRGACGFTLNLDQKLETRENLYNLD